MTIFLSKTIKKHKEYIKHVKFVLQNYEIDARLHAKLEKCLYHQPQVEFLEYIISNEDLYMDQKRFKPSQIS